MGDGVLIAIWQIVSFSHIQIVQFPRSQLTYSFRLFCFSLSFPFRSHRSHVPDNLNFSSLGGGGGMRNLLKSHKKRVIPRRRPLLSSANADGNDNEDSSGNDSDNLGLQLEPDGPPIEELAIEFTAAEIRQREAEVVAASEVWCFVGMFFVNSNM